MNERIRKLAEQAGLYVSLEGRPWPRSMSAEESNEAYSKFAELIVRECMDVLDPGINQVIARYQTRQWLSEHFGIEE